MKLLVLGGTVFLGRHVVESALAAGHDVTTFTRGQTNPSLYPEVEHLFGDRDGDLAALRGRQWDGVVDTSGYVPRLVGETSELLRANVDRYVFVSSVSAYADHSRPYDESTPLAELSDPTTEDVWPNYGPLKAACERVVDEVWCERGTNVRAGLIVGPYDPSDRFTYWTRRMADGGEVLAPGIPDRPIQFIDVRDLADWMVRLTEHGPGGAMNATGPATRLSMGELLKRLATVTDSPYRLTWVDDQALLDDDVTPWTELPLWLPGDEWAALLQADVSRALSAGLKLRPIEDTALDTLSWSLAVGEQRPTLTRERERKLLAAAPLNRIDRSRR